MLVHFVRFSQPNLIILNCCRSIPATSASLCIERADDMVSVHGINRQQLTAVSDFLKSHGGARESKTVQGKGELRI